MARLPIPGSDDGSWGDILNAYLLQSLTADGSIRTGVVGSPQLADTAVTSAKLAPSAVTSSHLSTGSVTNSAITDGAIAQSKIANLSGDLAGKANTTHTHSIADTTNLQTTLDSKADSVHTHTASQLSDASTAGRTLITAADATAQRTALGLGSAATLTVGTTAGTVAAGDDSRLTGALQASGLDAATAGLVGDSASATMSSLTSTFGAGVTLPAATGVDDTSAIQGVLTAHAGKRIVGRPGSAYKISAPLVVSTGTTLDMTGCSIALIAGSNCRMVQNVSLGGAGARDTDIRIVGGFWDRGTNGGATANDTHSIVLHRADRVSVTDIRFNATGACKYSIYLCDVTEALVERCDITSTSDGVHVTGPASKITVRDVIGTTEDDLVSFTGRDYTDYEFTAGGGDISNVLVERIIHRGGDANTVKLLPGAAKTLTGAVVRDVSGSPALAAVVILSDTVQASTTGGTVKGVVIDGVSGAPTGYLVDVAHPDVQALQVKNITTTKTSGRIISINTSGTTVTDAIIDGISTIGTFTGTAVHIGSGVTVTQLKVLNVNLVCGSAVGYVVATSGTISALQMANIAQTAGAALLYADAGGCPLISIDGLYCTANIGVAWSVNAATEIHVSGVTATPSNGRLAGNYSTSGTITLRGNRIVGTATTHLYRSTSQTIRATGDVRCDVSTLTPVAGDIAVNTNAALGCGAGPVISNGTLWKHLYTGATT